MKPASKILVVELDGGTWDVIQPLVDKGLLPEVKRLMDSGAWGVLRSEQPMISPRIWTSIFTGKSSKKHGVEFFGDSAKSVRHKRLWDIFNDRGNKVGVAGSLVTWPPYPINGFIIPSVFAMGPETYPEEYRSFQEVVLRERKKLTQKGSKSAKLFALLKAVKGLRSNGISPATFNYVFKYFLWEKAGNHTSLDKYWRKATIYHKMLTELFIHLYKKFNPDFATFHVHLCDAISHRYWEFYEPEAFPVTTEADRKKFQGVIPEAYMELDRTVGRFLSMIDENTTVVFVSDHGFGAIPDAIQPHILDIEGFLKLLGLEKSVIPARFGIKVYLTFPSRDEAEMRKAMAVIERIVFADTKEKIFKVDLYERYLSIQTTPKLWRSDVNDDTAVTVADMGTRRFGELFPSRKLRITGVHKDNGVFLFHGKNVKKGVSIKDASIMDVAPTVLALAGYPAAKDMDGAPIEAVFSDDFLKSNPISYIKSYESGEAASEAEEPVDYDKIKKRLETLGYM